MYEKVAEVALIPNFKDLFKMLDKYLDKKINEGCYFIDKYHWDNSNDLQYNKIISVGKEYKNVNLIYYISDFTEGTHLHSIYSYSLLNERKDYKTKNKNEGELRYKILGKIPTNSIILKFIDKNVGLWNISKENITYIEKYFRDININIKEPIEMNNEEIIKLIKFLEEIVI